MARRFASLLVVFALAAPAALAAMPIEDGSTYLERLDAAVDDGLLDKEQALLHAFAYGFDHDALPPEWTPDAFPVLKCGTELVRRYLEMKEELSVEAVERIEGYLAPAPSADKAVLLSPQGRFSLTYQTIGSDAVPLDDTTPANGVPDFVERCAEYLDVAWQVEIETLGYPAPSPAPYPVSFENMSFYGYIAVVSGTETRIVLHNSFEGFPPTNDPAGDVAGAAKAICAHEFRHASQRVQSGWSEGEWVELDAVWIEDVVFDESDLYYNDLAYGSGISDPDLPLDDGGAGSYEDCIWQHWMSQTYGVQIVNDFWIRRGDHTTEPVLTTYDEVLKAYGSSLDEGLATYAAWNAMTGARALDGQGYEEAAGYPTGPATVVGLYPETRSGATPPLASQNILCIGFSGLPGSFSLRFDGEDGAALALTAVAATSDGGGVVEAVALDAFNDADVLLGVPLDQMAWAMLVITQGEGNDDAGWSLEVDVSEILPEPAVAVGTHEVVHVQNFDDIGVEPVTVTNTGAAGSVLTFSGIASDTQPEIGEAVAWLSPTPSGPIDVAAGDSYDLMLGFDTAGMEPGYHHAYVIIEHNAPGPPEVIDVTLAVVDPTTAAGRGPVPLGIGSVAPNPFNPSTTIRFNLAEAGRAVVAVHDFRGRLVRTLLDRDLPAGPGETVWNGRDDAGRNVGSGAYLVRVSSGGNAASRTLTLSR